MPIRRVTNERYYSIPHRCTICDARRTFRLRKSQHYDDKRVKQKCERCGHDKFYVDKWKRRENRRKKCDCGGYPFIHRKNGGFCYESQHAEMRYVARENLRAA